MKKDVWMPFNLQISFHEAVALNRLQLWFSWSPLIQSCAANCDSPACQRSSRAPKLQKLHLHFVPVDRWSLRKSTSAPFNPPGPNDRWWLSLWNIPALSRLARREQRKVIPCAAESQLQCCLAKAAAFPRRSTQLPPSGPAERKYQRVLLKQCGFNLRGVWAFKNCNSVSPSFWQELFFFFSSSVSLLCTRKPFHSWGLVSRRLLRNLFSLFSIFIFPYSFLCSSVFDDLLFSSSSLTMNSFINGRRVGTQKLP